MRFLTVAVLGFLLLTSGLATAKEAVQNVVPTGVPGYVPSGGAGFAFVLTNQTTLTALGYHLDQQSGDQMVEVLDDQSNVLAAARISLADTQVGQFWYHSLPGLALPVNRTNYIVGYDAGLYATSTNKVWFGTLITTNTLFTIAPELKYLGAAQGTNIPFSTNFLYYGANFMFGPPRPPLYIQPTATNSVLLLWPTQAVGFSLQGTANIVAWPGTNLNATAVVSGTNKLVTLPATGPLKFFRLKL